MRAVVVGSPGGVDALQIVDLPVPDIAPGEVLVKVAAAGVNRADTLQRQGFYDPPPGSTPVLGLECAGVIEAVGQQVTGLSVGDDVCALLTGGGYADYVAVPAGQVAPVPAGLDPVAAGGLMETFATVWSNVFEVGKLRAGQTVLIHGGSSGIGTTAIQLAKEFGATVVTTVGSPEKAEFCHSLGADVVIDYRREDFAAAMRSARIQADVILDIVGAKYLEPNISVLATNGRLVVIGLQGGLKGELNLGALLTKRASVTATSLRARPEVEKSALISRLRDQVWPLLEDGTVRPIVHSVLPLDQVAQAHSLMESSTHLGKIILTMS